MAPKVEKSAPFLVFYQLSGGKLFQSKKSLRTLECFMLHRHASIVFILPYLKFSPILLINIVSVYHLLSK